MYGTETLNIKLKCLDVDLFVISLTGFLMSNSKLPDDGVHPQMTLLQVQGVGVRASSVQT